MRFYLFSVVVFSLFLTACYNKEFNEPGSVSINRQPIERTYEMQFQRVWAATQQIVGRLPIAQKEQDQNGARAFIVTEWMEGHSDVLYSGFAENRVPYPIRYRFYIYVVGDRASGRTQVRIENVEQYKGDVITQGVDFEGSVETWTRTRSSTLKEKRIFDEIQKLIADRSFQDGTASR